MDVSAVSRSIEAFLKKEKQAFYQISTNQSKALELAVTVGVTEHYRSNSYSVSICNPANDKNTFVVKTSTRGHPWNFSYVHLERDGKEYEAHMNLMVQSAHDLGHYCVDVGIAKAGVVPKKATKSKWVCLSNHELVTFAEVKKLVVYPMLLAQFVGIVHEIKPPFIGGRMPRGFIKEEHLLPALASLGNFSGNSSQIVQAYKKRGIRLVVAENFDMRLASVRLGHRDSPFADEKL